MKSVRNHVLSVAQDYEARAVRPVVAADVLGADKSAQWCRTLAAQMEGLSDEESLALLKQRQQQLSISLEGGLQMLASLHLHQLMHELIDPVAREKVGWIELSYGVHRDLPMYRRMLGINQQVGSCTREVDEPDAQWLVRREAWLARYHPQVPVVRMDSWSEDRARYTAFVSTAGEFATVKHLKETGTGIGTLLLRKNGFANSLWVVAPGPLEREDADILARSVPEEGELGVPPGSVVQTKYGRCAVVA